MHPKRILNVCKCRMVTMMIVKVLLCCVLVVFFFAATVFLAVATVLFVREFMGDEHERD